MATLYKRKSKSNGNGSRSTTSYSSKRGTTTSTSRKNSKNGMRLTISRNSKTGTTTTTKTRSLSNGWRFVTRETSRPQKFDYDASAKRQQKAFSGLFSSKRGKTSEPDDSDYSPAEESSFSRSDLILGILSMLLPVFLVLGLLGFVIYALGQA